MDINGAGLSVQRNGSVPGLLTLPITAYTNSAGATTPQFIAAGPGSRLDLPSLASLAGGLGIRANGGGTVSLPALAAMSGPLQFNVNGPGSVIEAGTIHLDTQGELSTTNAGEVRVRGDVTYALTDPARFSSDSGGTLTLLGGAGDCRRFEVAGSDLGAVPSGFTSNFSIDHLRIGPGAHIRLVDQINNGHRGGIGGAAEALYVNTLEFMDPSAQLGLGGLHLYYHTLIGSPGQILPFGCNLSRLPDLDHDGDVDSMDLASFIDCLSGPTIPALPGCQDRDLDGDQDVDSSDFGIIQRCYGGSGTPLNPKCAD